MDQALTVHGEIDQKLTVSPDAPVIQVGELFRGLDSGVLFGMIEPSLPDGHVTLRRDPDIAVGMPGAQFIGSGISGIDHPVPEEGPVGLGSDAALIADPPAARASVGEDDGLRLVFADNRVDLREIVIGPAVDAARLAGAAVPAVATVRPVEPDLGYGAVTGHQFPELVMVILRICWSSVGSLMTVPGRQIYSELKAMARAGLRQFAHHIPLIGRGGDGIIRIPGRPQAEAVVVLCSDDDALYACGFESAHPLLAVKPAGIEDRRVGIAVSPLAVRESIGPEMDECPYLVLLPGELRGAGKRAERLRSAPRPARPRERSRQGKRSAFSVVSFFHASGA